jgi:predicted DNA-binding transcriptional regulator YafY
MSRPGRLLDLVHLLSGRRPRTVEEMARRFEVTPRTVYRDLAELQERHVPLVREEDGWRLLEGATLRPLNLTAEERAVLQLALGNPALRRQPGLRRHLDRLAGKLDAVTALAEEAPGALELAGLERSGAVADGVLEVLERGARDHLEVEILYSSLAGGTRRWRGVDPYRLFHRDGAWYLVGRCHLHDAPRTFRLDRVGDARTLGVPFEPPGSFDLDAYLRDTWSVYRGERRHRVILRFDAGLAPLLENAVHHRGEELERLGDGAIEYRVALTHLDEIARWVLGFGGRCRVMEPEELRRRVLELARATAATNAPAPHGSA